MLRKGWILLTFGLLSAICAGFIALTPDAPMSVVLIHGFIPESRPTGRRASVGGTEFAEIGAGWFRMGSEYRWISGDLLGAIGGAVGCNWGQPTVRLGIEWPVHWVTFEGSYWIARTEVTNALYEVFAPMRRRGESSPEANCPVVNVSWTDAVQYCDWFARRWGIPVRLPSEAEWENACRAGKNDEYCFGEDVSQLADYAQFEMNSNRRTCAVGAKRCNEWGIYDMHGNVMEWCQDTGHDSYEASPRNGLPWVTSDQNTRVVRGGCWSADAESCRSAFRIHIAPVNAWENLGFRMAFSLDASEVDAIEPYLIRD